MEKLRTFLQEQFPEVELKSASKSELLGLTYHLLYPGQINHYQFYQHFFPKEDEKLFLQICRINSDITT